MPAPGPWTICYTLPDGQQSCFDIPVVVDWPPEIDEPDPVILDQLGRLQALAGQATDGTLKMQLTQALDEAVGRLGAKLPARFEFRRAPSVATHDDLGDPDRFTVLPDVTGLFDIDGWNTLHNAGYTVKQIPWRVVADLDGVIVSQDPPGGTPDAPPGLVTIWVGLAFPSPPDPPPQTT
jgi:hypothetical protein